MDPIPTVPDPIINRASPWWTLALPGVHYIHRLIHSFKFNHIIINKFNINYMINLIIGLKIN